MTWENANPGSIMKPGTGRFFTRLLLLVMLIALLCQGTLLAQVSIVKVDPTPFFPKVESGQPLRQQAVLHVRNDGAPLAVTARITVGNIPAYTEELGNLASGESASHLTISDMAAPTNLTVELVEKGTGRFLSKTELAWQPAKKWKIFCVSYSHHDLGFGNYPHRLRTEIRHANIERPLKYCTETDAWDEDSKFRFVIETGEPITSFLGSHSAAEAEALAERIREGRIQIGAVHNTANTEQLSYELMARLFYITGRHSRDLLGMPQSKTVVIDDVIGLTWPLATYIHEAGIPYFFHGHNGCSRSLQPADSEPLFYWQGPGQQGKVLVRSIDYGGYAGDILGDASEGHIQKTIEKLGANWPYNSLFLQEGTDFQLVTMDNARKIHDWNAKYAYPRLICATMDMFFDDVVRQTDLSKIKTFSKDANNQWADQDSNDAWLLGKARRQGEAIPTAEKFSTIATALTGRGYPWLDLYQAYHRLLLYHEHTNAIDFIDSGKERLRQYETELQENREMVLESENFSKHALDTALEKLTGIITTSSDKNILVFNPLAHARSDVVRVAASGLGQSFNLVDASNGKVVPHQILADGTILFVAADVPSLGYKTYSVAPAAQPSGPQNPVNNNSLENQFYLVRFDPSTGAITSIRDKQLNLELVDQSSPHKFNEYLYERYEAPTLQDPSKWYRVQKAQLSATSGPVASLMTVKAIPPAGVDKLTQTVILYHNLKKIDFLLDMVKSPSGRNSLTNNISVLNKESVYVALPLAVPEFQFYHELPGGVAEPIRDQFDGSCTAYYAVRHFTDVANKKYGVTVSSPEASLVEYGRPRSCPIPGGREGDFEKIMEYPKNSRLYLYLANNMFDVNVRWDQQGPMSFSWSIRSHAGNWQAGNADQFGWETQNPLLAKVTVGQKKGLLPGISSFMSTDHPNVICSTIKPAEANGSGLILRFNETQGKETTVHVALPFLKRVNSAIETDLVENDRPGSLQISEGNKLTFTILPFGVKTLRVLSAPDSPLPSISSLQAAPLSDMQVELIWTSDNDKVDSISHYNVYRSSKPDFQPGLINLAGRSVGTKFVDQPQLNYGGWINNRVEPETRYYYCVAAVDRWNNEGPRSPVAAVATFKSNVKNMVPLGVEGLRAIVISPLGPHNSINLLFRTNCESDVRQYEIHRSTKPGFVPDSSTWIGVADANGVVKGSTEYGHVPIDYHMGDYDHMMFWDEAVQPAVTYYYRVCAVDGFGQRGEFSAEASATTRPQGKK
jgi:hypothetical protein